MTGNHAALGITLLILTLGFLGITYSRAPKQAPIAFWGWGGLAIILSSEALLILRIDWVTNFFTPLAWTGYLLFIDALVWSLKGISRLGRAPKSFLALAFWSVPLWLIFEAYNLHLKNWAYIHLPQNTFVRGIGYVWSFATIWPAIFETADFLAALGFSRGRRHRTSFLPLEPSKQREGPDAGARRPLTNRVLARIVVVGLVMVTLPVILPARLGAYLFGAVWMGFVPLLDPLNYLWGGRSFLRELREGNLTLVYSLLGSGCICGILWEFWNYWANARWVYVFPMLQGSKIFEMPAAGFLGFPPFALECFVMYEFLRTARNQALGLGRKRKPELEPEPARD